MGCFRGKVPEVLFEDPVVVVDWWTAADTPEMDKLKLKLTAS